MDADHLLAELEAERYSSPGEAMGLLTLAIGAINREMDEVLEAEQPSMRAPRTPAREQAGGERIKRQLDRLHEEVRKIARTFKARGFSVSVGLPLGVSVSVDWEVTRDEDG